MKKIKILCALLLSSIAMVSCVNDDSTLGTIALNDITISALDDTEYTANLGEEFTLEPTVEYTNDDVSYVWYMYANTIPRDTLSQEKNLKITLTGDRALPGLDYKIVFRVTDNATGVFAEEIRDFKVESDFSTGMMLLCERDGVKELNMEKSDGRLLTNLFDSEKLANMRTIKYTNPNSYASALKVVFLFGEDYTGGYVLEPITLATRSTIRDYFEYGYTGPTETINVSFYGKMGNPEYLMADGLVYKKAANMGRVEFESSSLVVFGISPTNYRITGVIDDFTSSPTLYDELNGRLIAHDPWNMGALKPLSSEYSTKTAFDYENMGEYNQLGAGTYGYYGAYLLGKERNDNSITLFKFENYPQTYGSTGKPKHVITTDKVEVTSDIAPNIANGANFQSVFSLGGFLFYNVGDKVCALNAQNASSTTSQLSEVVLKDFATDNMEVTGLELSYSRIPAPTDTNPSATKSASVLRVFVVDNSLSELKGGYITYEITTSGGLQLTEVSRNIGGYCDKIIDLEEKLG